MSINRAKPIGLLYEDCAEYDLVVVPDAPLASALNRRLEHPHFGPFAITPRRLAAARRETAEDRLAFLEVITQTDLAWKEASFAVGNVLQCWEYQGAPEAILGYDAFDTQATREVVDCIAELDTTSRRLTDYTIDADQNVAVVGIDQLTTLERSILPQEYATIDPFVEATFNRPPFRLFDSPAAIVDTLLDTITTENAAHVAVVLDQASGYSSLVESALEHAEIPFYGGPGFFDDQHHRAFLQLLRAGYTGRDTRVGDVRPLLTQLGIEIDIEHDEKRLRSLSHSELAWVNDFCEALSTYTFANALDEYEQVTTSSLRGFREELSRLGILSERVTESRIDRLEFYVHSYEVPIDRENEGVLLADAKSSAYVDRPLVFYLGLDEDWTRTSPPRPWVDSDEEFERHIQAFQLLLQNGVDQYYLVQDTVGGTPVTPCLYFEELLDESFERFSDLESLPHSRTYRQTGDGFEKEPVEISAREIETVSQSSLSTFVNCPRDYLFSRILDGPDKDYFKEGNLFHDFAELYVNHPDWVDEAVIEEVVEAMVDEMTPYTRGVEREIRTTKYRIGLETITDFLDDNPPRESEFVTPDTGWLDNFFEEYFEKEVDAPITEQWFEDDDLGLKGLIDLVHSPTQLLDYKSGSKKSATQVVKNSALDASSDTPNFQALLYLTFHRTRNPGEDLEFTFFHFLETLDDVVTGDAAIDDCLTTVTYYPVSFESYISDAAVFDELRNDAAKNCQKTFSLVEYDDYCNVIESHAFPDTRSSSELIDSELGQALIERMQELVGEYKYVESGCKQALRHLIRIRKQSYFMDDLDAFEDFVEERIEEVNRYRRGEERYPINGLGGEPNYRRVDNRDCLLEGDVR